MRPFGKLNWSEVKDGELVLMTVEHLGDPEMKMSVADFRDDHALFIPKVRRWVGMSPTRGLRFGVGPLRMTGGVWYCSEDRESQRGHEDFEPTPGGLSLEPIK